jgi:type I restriction enzyme S subunit
MDTAKFFEKFELFAHPEEAAKHFREVVLNLAFSGKLKGTDLSGWETHPIGDFFTEGLKSINAPDTPNQTYELWSVPSFETGAPEIVTGAQVGSTKRELRDGTILLGKINPHLNRIWVVSRRTNHPMIASQEWINITAGDTWDTGYLARLLSSPSFNRSICATAQGMGSLTRANTKQVAQILVHRPPLREQKKLIAKVDELMALCDRLEAQLKERDVKQAALAKAALAKFTEDPTPENLQLLFHPSFSIEPDHLRKTLTSLCVRGKLIPQKPDETTSIRSSIVDLSPLFEIPKNWTWVLLGDLQPDFQNGESSRGDQNGVPVIVVRLSDIHNRRINLEQPRRVAIDPGQIKKYALVRGDTLVTRVNGSAEIVGRFIPVTESLDAIHCDHFIRMRIDAKKIYPPFTAVLGESLHVRDQIQKLFVSTTGQKTVNQGHICSLTLPLPPLNEQVRIVAKLEELMKLIDQLEAQLETSRTTGEKLLEAMVAELTSA